VPETISQIDSQLLDVPREKRPRHIAVIMDGNGRWAQQRGLPRIEGHRQGAVVLRQIINACQQLAIDQLTLFCFSSENWKRPSDELDGLMHMLKHYMIEERPNIMENNLVMRVIGRREGLPADVVEEMEKTVRMSANNTGPCICLAINYGGRAELLDAVQAIARDVQEEKIATEDISEQTISDHLYTTGMPDPDLLIRTAGEMRVSNFLLWQISYTELWITKVYWPEFTQDHLQQAIRDYAARDRRFGGLTENQK